MPYLGMGLWEQIETSVWLEIGYHVANGLLMLWLMYSYLKEEWFMVKTDFRYYVKHAFLTVGLVVVAESVLLIALNFFGFDITDMLESLPIVEMTINTPVVDFPQTHSRNHNPDGFRAFQHLRFVLLLCLCADMLQKTMACLSVHTLYHADSANH